MLPEDQRAPIPGKAAGIDVGKQGYFKVLGKGHVLQRLCREEDQGGRWHLHPYCVSSFLAASVHVDPSMHLGMNSIMKCRERLSLNYSSGFAGFFFRSFRFLDEHWLLRSFHEFFERFP